MNRIVVAAFVLTSASASAQSIRVVDPQLDRFRSVAVSSDSSLRPASGFQQSPAIASNGTLSVAVWSDRRYGNYDVFATRVSADGKLLDPAGIPVSPSWADDLFPDVVWDGSEFFITWTNSLGLFAARVTVDGAVTPLGAIISSSTLGSSVVSFNGTKFLLAFNSSTHPEAVFVDRDGHILGSRMSLSESGSVAAISTDGDAFLVVYTQNLGVCARRVDASGTLTDREILGSFFGSGVTVAFGHGEYLVVYPDNQIRAIRVGRDGHAASGSVPFDRPKEYASYPTVAAVEEGWLLVWASGPVPFGSSLTLIAMTISPSLQPLTASKKILNAPVTQLEPRIVHTDLGHAAVWIDRTAQAQDVDYATLDRTGTLTSSPAILAFGVPKQSSPVVATGGDQIVCIWREQVLDNVEGLMWRRFDSSGHALDERANPLPVTNTTFDNPVVAAGRNFVVVWSEGGSNIRAARISRDGMLLDREPIVVGTGVRPAVASDGNDFFMTWTSGSEIRGVMVSDAGLITSTEFAIATSDDATVRESRVTWTGTEYFVAWSTSSLGPYGGSFNTRARFLSRSGVPTSSILELIGSRYAASQWSIASSSQDQLVTGINSYLVRKNSPPQMVVVRHPFVVFNGREYLNAPNPIAPIADDAAVIAFSQLVPMLPAAHNGGVERVFLQFVPIGRHRAVPR